jgi:hypothetical protein
MGLVPAAFCLRLFVIAALVMMMSVSCDLPQSWRDGKGSLTIALPGAPASARAVGTAQSFAARAVHLPEEITNNMKYEIYLFGPGGGYSKSIITQERVVTVDLEPGLWDISVSALHPASSYVAGEAWVKGITIRAGRENFVSLTMIADEGLAPWGDLAPGTKDVYVGVGDSIILQVDVDTTVPYLADAFETYSGFSTGDWVNKYQYRWYWEDENGNILPGGPALDTLSFPQTLSYSPDTTSEGYFTYYVEFANEYEWKGDPVAKPAKNSIKVAVVEVDAASTAYNLGGTGPGGGTIFYKGPKFVVNGQPCHYLEVGPDLGEAQWGLDGIYVGARSSDYPIPIGRGYGYTQIILAALGISGELTDISADKRVAQLCDEYENNGYSDWFLPSDEELDALYYYSTNSGTGLFGSNTLWSSTESSEGEARVHWGTPSSSRWREKTSSYHVRPVRAF